jgi:hypothetical protein
MDRQNIIVKQPYRTVHEYEDAFRARLDYIRLVPITRELHIALQRRAAGTRDKIVLGYNEPYSWAFYENVQTPLQHREPLLDFQRAGVDIVDIQISRLGMRPVFETRTEEPLLWATRGDPVRGKVPETSNVGRMQQYTNTLDAGLRYCRELGMKAFANLGAGNAYQGSPLQGEFSKAHPVWHNGAQMRYDIPEVREHMLAFYREALEIGADGISIDYCRYPHGQANAEVCTAFLRSLRTLADEFSAKRGAKIPISVRFPAKGVARWEWFDYAAWCREGLVDYLCPSNIQARHLNFDIGPYVAAVKGTDAKLCPVVDALEWGLAKPGEFLRRVKNLYTAGADGIYIYQCDAAVHESGITREMVRLCGSTEALDRWFAEEAALTAARSKDIILRPPTYGETYNRYERARIWLEGITPGEVDIRLDGKQVNRFDQPPYWVGTEESESDSLLAGDHMIHVRARDGGGWLEKTFRVRGE